MGGSGRGEEPSGEVILRLIRDPFNTLSLGESRLLVYRTLACQALSYSAYRSVLTISFAVAFKSADSSSRNAVNISSERKINRFP